MNVVTLLDKAIKVLFTNLNVLYAKKIMDNHNLYVAKVSLNVEKQKRSYSNSTFENYGIVVSAASEYNQDNENDDSKQDNTDEIIIDVQNMKKEDIVFIRLID